MDELLNKARGEAGTDKSDREILLGIENRLERLERREKTRTLITAVVVGILIVVVAVLAFVWIPRLSATIDMLNELGPEMQEVADTIDSLELDRLKDAVDTISSIDFDRLSGIIDRLSKIDFEGIGSTIDNLKQTLDPLLKLFGK